MLERKKIVDILMGVMTIAMVVVVFMALFFFFGVSPAFARIIDASKVGPNFILDFDPSVLDISSTHPSSYVPAIEKPAGLTSCFDFYRFGSVQLSVSTAFPTVAQGSVVPFRGTISNQNHYPIVDATVYVKIFRDRTKNQKSVNGPDVVDWFPAVEHLTLKADESRELSFNWHVPQDAATGHYEAVMYVTSSDRFELSGLVFTDDVTGSMEPFDVVGVPSDDTRFDKAGVTVNGNPFYFAASPPTVDSSTKVVTVSAPVMNASDRAYSGTISWKLYYWDQLQADHLIAQSSDTFTLSSHATTSVSYVVNDTSHAVYYLVGSLASASGAKSIIGVRFVRDSVPEPRINAMGVNAYPATQGTIAFVCVHSTSNNFVKDARVELSVMPAGFFAGLFGPLAHSSYTGVIPGDIYALTAPLTGGATSFDLIAKLYNGQGVLIDSVTIPYRCSDLGGACSNTTLLISIGALVLTIIIGGIVIIRRRHTAHTEQQDQSIV